ncbi:MAG: RidA family protein [Alphaproteobacteria bacterium]|nr:RidA family protein [Alphaproteobacteria bacterium]
MQYHNMPGLDPPTSPYSHVVECGGLVCLAGQVAADSPEGRQALGNVAAETRAVMEQIKRALAARGLGFADVQRVDIHLVDLGDMRIVDPIYGGYFAAGRYPARTCVEVRRLYGNSRIEVTVMARRPAAPVGESAQS